MTTSHSDFDHHARQVIQLIAAALPDYDTTELNDAIVEHFRQIWNLRGAFDIAAIDEVAHTNETAVEAAIESLNR